jgi:hypothetical protein
MLPVALAMALFHEVVIIVYHRLFSADYRDLVKEVSLLGRDHSEPLTIHQRLGVWDVEQIPIKSVASQKWAHFLVPGRGGLHLDFCWFRIAD